jgi:hypothetical protein
MGSTEFDDKFDLGEDITELLDISQAKRPGVEQKRAEPETLRLRSTLISQSG